MPSGTAWEPGLEAWLAVLTGTVAAWLLDPPGRCEMTLLGLIIVLAIVGFCTWLVVTYIPMPQPVKTVIIVVVVLFILLWALGSIGLLGPLNTPIRPIR